MKILHTSDWHLGKRLDDFSRMEEQRAITAEICEIATREQVDAVVVAGDLFDTFNPPTEAVELLYSALKRLTDNGKRPVIAIAGNHDSPERTEAPDPLARECGIVFVGYPNSVVPPFELETGLKVLHSEPGFLELALPETGVPLRILLTPYANEARLKTCLESCPETDVQETEEQESEVDPETNLRRLLEQMWLTLAEKYCDGNGINLMVSHLFMNREGEALPEEPEDEKPILHIGGAQVIYTENIPRAIQYAALGHLHRMQPVDTRPCPVYYSGSPLSYSFSEADQQKYVLIAEVEPGSPATVRSIKLTGGKKLLRKRADGVEEALQWLSESTDALVELTLATDTYLTATDRRRLQSAHKGIVWLIPEVKGTSDLADANQNTIDPAQSMEDLFKDYFKHEKGCDPNEEIMQLFTEMLAEEDEP